jgi:flagellin
MLNLSPNLDMAPRIEKANKAVEKSTERLSSGQRINRAADDAAGLTISEKMRSEVMGSNQAAANIQDAIKVVQIGEDGVGGLFPVMQRIRELIVEAGNSTKSPSDLQAIQNEIDQIKNQVPAAFDIAHQFNVVLANPPGARILEFQVGADNGQTETVDYNALHNVLQKFTIDAFGYKELYNSQWSPQMAAQFGSPLPLPTDVAPAPLAPLTYDQAFPKKLVVSPNTAANTAASFAITDTALTGLTAQAGYLGAQHNRLEHQLNNVTNYAINDARAESQIRDADMASEMSALTRSQIMQNAATALVGQANTRPEVLLKLLKGG